MITRTCALYGNSRRIILILTCFTAVLVATVAVCSLRTCAAVSNTANAIHDGRTERSGPSLDMLHQPSCQDATFILHWKSTLPVILSYETCSSFHIAISCRAIRASHDPGYCPSVNASYSMMSPYSRSCRVLGGSGCIRPSYLWPDNYEINE